MRVLCHTTTFLYLWKKASLSRKCGKMPNNEIKIAPIYEEGEIYPKETGK